MAKSAAVVLASWVLLSLLVPSPACAQAPQPEAEKPQVVDLRKVNRQVWASGQKVSGTEVEVVQQRRYSSAQRLELQLSGGISVSDPFLSVKQVGGSLGYHFNHFYSIHLLYWKYLVARSSASDAFYSLQGTLPAVNQPKSFMGAEFEGNLLYGKLSLLGKSIIYIDVFALGGAGIQQTDAGSAFAPFVGLGQMVYLSSHFALKLGYRVLRYSETVQGTSGPLKRTNVTEAVNLGLSYLF